jgi:hypothetical protein
LVQCLVALGFGNSVGIDPRPGMNLLVDLPWESDGGVDNRPDLDKRLMAMGFAVNRSGSLSEPSLMTPTLKGSPSGGVALLDFHAPPGGPRSGGAFFAPLP